MKERQRRIPHQRSHEVQDYQGHPLHADLTQPSGKEYSLMRSTTEELKTKVREQVREEELPLVNAAFAFAEKYHAGQFREDGKTPHMNHVLRVAARVAEQREYAVPVPIEHIIIALLHDSQEDSPYHQNDKQRSQHAYQQDFYLTFKDEPLKWKIYAGVHTLNKFGPLRKKTEEEYHTDISLQLLWDIKAFDRVDSLLGDISAAERKGRETKSVARVQKSRNKLLALIPEIVSHAPHAARYAMQSLEYAELFTDKTEQTVFESTTLHVRA